MINGVNRVVLVDIGSETLSNGDRVKRVISGKVLALRVDLVGIATMQLGQSQGMQFTYSIEISRNLYNNEKYCFVKNQLFEIKGFSKAKSQLNMLMNISKIEDKEIEKAISSWLEGR